MCIFHREYRMRRMAKARTVTVGEGRTVPAALTSWTDSAIVENKAACGSDTGGNDVSVYFV